MHEQDKHRRYRPDLKMPVVGYDLDPLSHTGPPQPPRASERKNTTLAQLHDFSRVALGQNSVAAM
jgi:hypothetical protein